MVVPVDFLNNFTAEYKDQSIMVRVMTNISKLVEWARNSQIEVIFVQFYGDEQFQHVNWRHRNQIQGRRPWCVQGTWGAEICSNVTVQANECVFEKRAQYDPFLGGGFAQYVACRGFEHLMVAGLYADVCVDATVRGAFQQGLWTTIVRECIAPLHFQKNETLQYMQRVHGSTVITMGDLLPAGERSQRVPKQVKL